MDTDFLDNLREYTLNMFDCDIEINHTGDIAEMYFCTIYLDYEKNRIMLELKYEDMFAREIFYLTRFICEEGVDSQLMTQTSNRAEADYIVDDVIEDDFDDSDKEKGSFVVSPITDRDVLHYPFRLENHNHGKYVTNTKINFSLN